MEESLNNYIEEYKIQLKKGNIPKAYKGLMKYVMSLKVHLANKYPDFVVSGNIYHGCMDFTYFTLTSKSLKSKNLKIGIALNHEEMQFEIWLAGQNKQIVKKYWELLKDINWKEYNTPPTPKYSIVEHVLVENPDFDDLDSLTNLIETGAINFVKDVTEALD